jgi:hypothetical protein
MPAPWHFIVHFIGRYTQLEFPTTRVNKHLIRLLPCSSTLSSQVVEANVVICLNRLILGRRAAGARICRPRFSFRGPTFKRNAMISCQCYV